MHLSPLLLALLQQPAVPSLPPSPVVKVEITPAGGEIQIGQTLKLSARALDAGGQPVANARIYWFVGSDNGEVDSTGMVTGGYGGPRGGGGGAAVLGTQGQQITSAVSRILPEPRAGVEVPPPPTRGAAPTRPPRAAPAAPATAGARHDPVTFTSSNPRVASVTNEGVLRGLAPGRVTVSATAGPVTRALAIQVVANTVARVTIEPAATSVRTGDVVRLMVTAKDAAGRPIPGVTAAWSLEAGSGAADLDPDGAFVAELPGTYTVTAAFGTRTADAVVNVEPRRVTRGMEVRAHLPIKFSTAEVWVHPSGACAYLSTIADRVYAIDIADPAGPKIVDSMLTNARIVNDVMTTEDGKYGVFSREGASDRKNGIVVFDAGDPCHPKPIAEYTETVSGGVHSSYVYQGRAYITDDATGSMRVIDIRDPAHPKEVARWEAQQTEAGRYLHDIMVVDGLAYLAYWNDGLIILDVGNGMKGGSPENPQLVSQLKYDLNATYARVEQLWGTGFVRGTHTAWRAGKYVFVGDEVYAARPYKGLSGGNNLTFGRLHVVDVSDIQHPKEVAWYEPTDGGVHNVWVVGDTLYLGNYQGGARAVDISGELKGDLLREGREMSWILTVDSLGHRRAPFAWGAVVRDGNIFVPDINTGLWILRLEAKQPPVP